MGQIQNEIIKVKLTYNSIINIIYYINNRI